MKKSGRSKMTFADLLACGFLWLLLIDLFLILYIAWRVS